MKIRRNLVGQPFGRLTVIAHEGGRVIRCKCDCGNEHLVDRGNLTSGRTLSCGCLHKENHTTHGHNRDYSVTPEYTAWQGMRRRCEDVKFKQHGDYKNRGITYCERWEKFENFLADMGVKPSPLHTLDRKDNDGNYEPSNCRWATWEEQSRNKRSNQVLEFQGQRMCIQDWAEHVGLNRNTLVKRLRSGWPIEKALTTPVQA